MIEIKVKGKHDHLSKEEIRAMVQASMTVLEFHNKHPHYIEIDILVKDLTGRENDFDDTGIWGTASFDATEIELHSKIKSVEDNLTVILHECIHLCIPDMPSECSEKCTSTLTNRLKGDVAKIYNVLIEGTYKRAGYIAHTKMAYKTSKDFYDKTQYAKKGTSNHGKIFRKKGNRQGQVA